jgi:hypothetical protein
MTIGTLLRFLIGNREAIQSIASNKHTWWIGFLFVLSAGFAREYDGEDLLHEPWYLAIPIAASLGSSLLLFSVAYGIAIAKGEPARLFVGRYGSFLGLFWFTAPLAWVYAIPYEHFLSPADAMRANLYSLGIVSLWRVALMVRVLVVLLGYTIGQAICLVMTFATIVALTLIQFLPVPLIDVMGGIRLSERDAILRGVACAICQLGVCTLPFWCLGSLVASIRSKPTWQLSTQADGRPGSLPWLALASLIVWLFVLPVTQPPQIRRYQVDRLFAKKRIGEALEEMSRHTREDYPVGWEPPPRVFHHFVHDDTLIRVLEEMAQHEPADWVREAYLDRMPRILQRAQFPHEERFRRIGRALKQIRGGPQRIELLDPNRDDPHLKELRQAMEGKEPDPEPDPNRKED